MVGLPAGWRTRRNKLVKRAKYCYMSQLLRKDL
jgi:hypothetical protein